MALIVITGPDGAGKTTISKHFENFYQIRRISLIEELQKPYLKNFQKNFNSLTNYTNNERVEILKDCFLTIFSSLTPNENNILIEGYYYKYFATEMSYGANKNYFCELKNVLPEPELIIYLDSPPDISFKRKNSQLSSYEAGLLPSMNFKKSYIQLEFQEKTYANWDFIKTNLNNYYFLESDKAIDKKIELIAPLIKKCITPNLF